MEANEALNEVKSSETVNKTTYLLRRQTHFEMNTLQTLLLLSLAVLVTAESTTTVVDRGDRKARIFDWFNYGYGYGMSDVLPRCRGCPPRNCVRDISVIKGYCCGCARVSDLLPIDCPAINAQCPSDGRRLCRDYDYMLDCCCP